MYVCIYIYIYMRFESKAGQLMGKSALFLFLCYPFCCVPLLLYASIDLPVIRFEKTTSQSQASDYNRRPRTHAPAT